MGLDENQGKARDMYALFGCERGELTYRGETYPLELQSRPWCTLACPAGVNVKSYINLIANRQFERAVEVKTGLTTAMRAVGNTVGNSLMIPCSRV